MTLKQDFTQKSIQNLKMPTTETVNQPEPKWSEFDCKKLSLQHKCERLLLTV